MLWPEFNYDDEKSHPFGKQRPRDKNGFDQELFEYYKKLIHIRLHHKPLVIGDFKTLLTDNNLDVYAFQRKYHDEKIMVILNNSGQNVTISLKADGRVWVDLMTDHSYQVNVGSLDLRVDGKSGLILNRTE